MIEQDSINVIQGSDEWKLAKLGHVSASSIADVMAKVKSGEAITRRKYKVRLVAERLTGKIGESYTNPSMEHGVVTEPLAKVAYEVKTSSFIDNTGFWKHPTIKWVGCSPDGLIGETGLVECKCPNTTTHIDYLFADQIPTEYYKQIQCQLWVMQREWVDFISFDDRLPQKKQLFIKRAYRDEELIKEMEKEVIIFLDEVEQMMEKLNAD